jgi:hypothetical protein
MPCSERGDKKMLFRHGDVLIQQVDTLPQDVERVAEPVLAYGEVTGHSHQIEDPAKVALWRSVEGLFLQVFEPTRVIHEEHQPIALPVGIYKVWQQREYVPPGQRRNPGISFRTVTD